MSPAEPPGERRWTLLGADGLPYRSVTPGTLGGYRRGRIYGLLDCRSALRAIAAGGYVRHRVFFPDEETAVAAGYRPCAVCLPERYAGWKFAHDRPNGPHTDRRDILSPAADGPPRNVRDP